MGTMSTRQMMRRRRRDLSPAAQKLAAEKLAAQVCRLPEFLRSRRLAFYLPNDGEIDPGIIRGLAEASGKSCFLPVLHPLKFNRLYFVKHRNGDNLVRNRYGIAEPPLRNNPPVYAWTLDIIFVPLVAFDRAGHRLGMGGGFYDRTLAFTRNSPRKTPTLIGLAHSCQEAGTISAASWDIPLHKIATEREIISA